MSSDKKQQVPQLRGLKGISNVRRCVATTPRQRRRTSESGAHLCSILKQMFFSPPLTPQPLNDGPVCKYNSIVFKLIMIHRTKSFLKLRRQTKVYQIM